MTIRKEPYLNFHVIWHPSCDDSEIAAKYLIEHFTRDRYSIEDLGVSILQWCDPNTVSNFMIPFESDINDAVIVIVLISDEIQRDSDWSKTINKLAANCIPNNSLHSNIRLLPVAMTSNTLAKSLGVQAIQWCDWKADSEGQSRRLVREVTYETSRMLRTLVLAQSALNSQMKKIQVFLSHSKHDEIGEKVAVQIREWIANDVGVSVFFDVVDIPAGLPSDQVLDEGVRQSAIIVVYSDSYSSREWCMREVLVAKKNWRPMVVADCIEDTDERAFPYLGNVPFVRLNSNEPYGMERVVGRLLDEVLKDFIWQFRTANLSIENPNVMFSRCEPELLTLVNMTENFPNKSALVYPGPPLNYRELRLLDGIGPAVHSFSEWISRAA